LSDSSYGNYGSNNSNDLDNDSCNSHEKSPELRNNLSVSNSALSKSNHALNISSKQSIEYNLSCKKKRSSSRKDKPIPMDDVDNMF